jgi:hypothetical protein
MPTNALEDFEIRTIIVYLRSLAPPPRNITVLGDPVKGKEIFFGDVGCSTCHMVGGVGGGFGAGSVARGRGAFGCLPDRCDSPS